MKKISHMQNQAPSNIPVSIRSMAWCLCLIGMYILPIQSQESPPAWKYLFNGTDLSGWVNINGASDTWTAGNGVIECTGKPICALRTTEQYENFILELEWRHLRSGGNAGVFLWAAPEPAVGQPFLRAIEVQVLDHGYGKSDWFTTHGDIFPIHGSRMKPFPPSKGDRSFPSEERSNGAPQWNHYRIHCEDGTIRLSVNGKEVSGGSDCAYRKGYIALESEGSPVEFKNIRVQTLPSKSPLTKDMTAPLPGDFIHLYNGINLDGWHTSTPEFFHPSDWTLTTKPVDNIQPAPLWSHAQVGPAFEFFFDIKIPENADLDKNNFGSLCLFNRNQPAIAFGKLTAQFNLLNQFVKPGKWTRITIRYARQKLTVSSLGKSLTIPFDGIDDFFPSPQNPLIGILPSTQFPTDFANFFIRPIPE